MDSISLPVIAPRLDRLKRSGSWLHLLAGVLILAHAISHFLSETTHTLYFWCLLLISLDIFVLVLFGRGMLLQLPRLNLFFRRHRHPHPAARPTAYWRLSPSAGYCLWVSALLRTQFPLRRAPFHPPYRHHHPGPPRIPFLILDLYQPGRRDSRQHSDHHR